MGRVWLALLAAIVLLVAIVGAGGLIVQQQQNQRAQQTKTAQQTASAQANSTTAAQTAVAAITATAAAAQRTPIPSPTGTPTGIGQDVTTPPAPPDGVDAKNPMISDPSPSCGQTPTTPWEKSASVTTTCPDGGGVDLTTSVNSLGCIQHKSPTQTDGFVTAIAQPTKGAVVLGFRQGEGNSNGSLVNITGYYFQVDPATNSYALYSADADGKQNTFASGPLNGTLNVHFAVGVLYHGNKITPYINGIALPTVTDTTFTNGWMALCTSGISGASGETTYTNALMYPLAS
jgi:hypothetical protein